MLNSKIHGDTCIHINCEFFVICDYFVEHCIFLGFSQTEFINVRSKLSSWVGQSATEMEIPRFNDLSFVWLIIDTLWFSMHGTVQKKINEAWYYNSKTKYSIATEQFIMHDVWCLHLTLWLVNKREVEIFISELNIGDLLAHLFPKNLIGTYYQGCSYQSL